MPPHSEARYSITIALEYQLLGLADPLVCNLTCTVGGAGPTARPAPWSGFAVDAPADSRTGLAAGTNILTARGEVPVEHLVPGDRVLALRGPALLPIVRISRSMTAEPPVEIAAGAFGPQRPRKPLCVGAGHAIFLQTVPVAARELINGATVRSHPRGGAELFHIDVGFSDVLFADGLPLASEHR